MVDDGTSILNLSRIEDLCAKSKVILDIVSLLFWNLCVILERLVQEPKICWQWAHVFKVKTNAYPCFPCSCLFGIVLFYLLDYRPKKKKIQGKV